MTETYDLLRSSDVGESKWIRGAVALPIQHCLVVRRGKTLRDIKKVLSHEQVRAMFLEHATCVLIFYNKSHTGPGTVPAVPRGAFARGTAS